MVVARGRARPGAFGQLTYETQKREVGDSFRVLLEGQPLDGLATVVEHYSNNYGGGTDIHWIDINLFNVSERDIAMVQSMKSLSDTGTNFVRVDVANYDPEMPADELAVAFALMNESPFQYEGMVLHSVKYERLGGGETANMQIKMIQRFKPQKEVSP